ncbi:MAG: C1 family peptidase [Saprospiraceae bacterium]|nr:C1 family peptidase [Saprospiraceae bacterium]
MKTNVFLFVIFLGLTIASCDKDGGMSDVNVNPDLEYGLGANLDEDDSDVPDDLLFGNGNLPSSHDISQYLPPVGDQGNYGTCVSWALGYNLKTIIEAQDKNYSTTDLTDPSKQFSPKDLFLAIDKSEVGPNCNGTYLKSAMNAMQRRGIATQQTEPYVNLGDCSQQPSQVATQEAQNYKINNYRSVDIKTDVIKQYIANNRPVGFGARLGDNFMTWNSDDVLTGHTSFDNVGMHAGHAMTVIGYDDNKGPRGAFRVINSWGQAWGSQGFIWIDYDFFTSNDFCDVAYVATNSESNVDPNDPTDPTSQGEIDMIPWGLTDDPDMDGQTGRDRTLSYNVYNVGTETARASSDWSVVYIYYNAFDASDYGIMLYDYYSDDYGMPGENGELQSGPGSSGNWWNHVDVQGGSSLTQAVSQSDDNFTWDYQVPNITGYYYLVMIANPFGALQEMDLSNNYFYFTDEYGYPIWFQNGVPQGLTNDKNDTRSGNIGEETVSHLAPSEISVKMSNAYSKSEIFDLLQYEKQSGRLENKVNKFKSKKKVK